jgi:hypothetical protein
MATKEQTQANWKRTQYTTKVTLPSGRSKMFDMTKWYTHVDFTKLDECELDGIEYSVKQKLGDSLTQLGKGATDTMKFERYDEMWTRLCKDRQFNSPSKGGGGVRKPTFIEFWEVIGGKDKVPQSEAAVMYGKLYPVKSK